MEMEMQVPRLESLAEVAWHIGKIGYALNDPSLLSRWTEARKYPVATLWLFREVLRSTLEVPKADRDRILATIRKGQGQHVHLRPDWLRDWNHFIASFFDTSKPYALVERPGTRPPTGGHHPLDLSSGMDVTDIVDLEEWVKDYRIEVEGVEGVRTKDASEIVVVWSECPERAYGWDCVMKHDKECWARDYDFRYCQIKRVGLPRLYDQLMAYYDRGATIQQETPTGPLDSEQIDTAKQRDYSKLRREVLESTYPADQLLALYMVQRSQDGNYGAADRVVMAYAPVWRSVAGDFYYKGFRKVDRALDLQDIVHHAYNISVSALMGHNLETMEAARGREAPFSAEDITTLLNPRKLKEQLEFDTKKGPQLMAMAVLIYLLNRTLGNDLGNTEPLFTPGSQGTSLPLGPPWRLGSLLEYCAWVLLHESLPGVATAANPWVNANKFDPGRARWDLGGFFRMVVRQKLADIYEKGYTRQVEGKQVRVVAESLDLERKDEEGHTSTLGEMLPDSSNVEEESESTLVGEARTKALNELRGQLSATDHELWDKLRAMLEENPKAALSQMAKATDRDRKTLWRFFERVRPLAEKAGLRELM